MENRVIKFRAWDKVNNRMIYPASKNNDTYLVFEESGWFIVNHFTGKNETILTSEDGVLMQYTGRADQQKTPIYEGDVIRLEYRNGTRGLGNEKLQMVRILMVEYFGNHTHYSCVPIDGGPSGSYSVGFGGSAVKSYNVIGNIHQMPNIEQSLQLTAS